MGQICTVCGREFKGYSWRKSKYCSMECRDKDWHNAHAEHVASRKGSTYQHTQAWKEKHNAACALRMEQKEQAQRKKLVRRLCNAINAKVKAERTVKCVVCGNEFHPLNGRQICCSKECGKRRDNQRRDHRIYINGKPDLSISLTRLYMRDMGVCAICGRHIDFDCDSNSNDYPSVDHIVPLSKGGKHTWNNVQLACRGCNTAKGNRITPG